MPSSPADPTTLLHTLRRLYDEALGATMAIEENARLLYASIIGKPRTIPRKDTMKIWNKIQTEYGQRKNMQSTLK